MNSVGKVGNINKAFLDPRNYFSSLIEQGSEFKMISDSEIQKIQYDCLSCLSKLTERYANGDSSIRTEEAKKLLDSLTYTVGIYLKSFSYPDDAIEYLKNNSLDEAFYKGQEIIQRKIKITKMLYSRVLRNMIKTSNVFYNATLKDGISGFFKLYNYVFESYEIHITADYPVYNCMENLCGIEFIEKYIEYIYIENVFCSFFDNEKVEHLLSSIDSNQKELIINIYEYVLFSVIGCIIVNKDFKNINLSENDLNYLYGFFNDKNKKDIINILKKCFDKVSETLQTNEETNKYIKNSLLKMSDSIFEATRKNVLKSLFVVSSYNENTAGVKFDFGEKMNDKSYKSMIEEIDLCEDINEKLSVIKEYVHSLADFETVLLDATLNKEEINFLINSLSPIEFAVLYKKYHSENNTVESEGELAVYLESLFDTLTDKQKEKIISLKIQF